MVTPAQPGHAAPQPRSRWPLLALAVVLVLAGGVWWWLRPPDVTGTWLGHLDTLQIELQLREDGTFDWYLAVPGKTPAPGRPRASQWTGRWHWSDGDVVLQYEPKPPRNEAGIRYGRFTDGTLRTTFGMGGERATLRRRAP